MSRVPEPSVFLVVDEAKRKARERGVGLIDLSIGSTDLRALAREAHPGVEVREAEVTFKGLCPACKAALKG